ncbi:fungal-specific transcription factor domain-containing protein [Multifurca ochricompacta]|uniref:Fungal-specific transcription factor domain-containing protein n=1 Tax=Multifurca ochricompacta TaxID=376703 RepID=A0AAD4QS76_9AGAM|nr:fungal-specific transcription factor domain-containing protein [Multifurca ochricompacta]
MSHQYNNQSIPIHPQDQQHLSHSMQPPPSPPIPIDPALALYSPSYYSYHTQRHPQVPQQLSLVPSLSSPSSQASDAMSTPPTEQMSFSGSSKRPPSASTLDNDNDSIKRRKEDDGTAPSVDGSEPKAKPTRGSRACTVCRRLKMKCVGAEQGPPCKRCIAGNHECIFEESNRGKRTSNTRKHELLTRSLRKMERTLDTVLKSIGNPSITSGMVSRSPSPSNANSATQALLSQVDQPPSPTTAATFSSSSSRPQAAAPPGSPKLHSLPDNSLNPLGLLAEASLANRRAHATSSGRKTSGMARPPAPMGVASDAYFKPGPMTILPLRRLFIERQIQPEMLTFVSTEEVVALFDIYFEHLNMHCNMLDRDFHTPSLVCSRSPFLLTTICAISAKFYTARPELHGKLTELSKKLAFTVPAQGYKSLEIVQAYLLLALWGSGPVERYEQDRTWMLLGMAIRMATDLNLHRKTATISPETPEGKARDQEVHNRERTWLVCFSLDRSTSAQMGKPSSIREDCIIRNALQWVQSPLARRGDFSLVAYVELQRIISRTLDLLYSETSSPSGLLVDVDYLLVIKTFERQIQTWYSQVADADKASDRIAKYNGLMAEFFANYAMLVINSFGLQNAMERSPVDIPHFFARVHSSAKTCALLVKEELGPLDFLKYSPDSHFVFTSYAVLSLLKLLRPEFPASRDHEHETLQLVQNVAETFDQISAGPTHTPSLYSTFLRALLAAKTEPPSEAGSDSGDNEAAPHMSGNPDQRPVGNTEPYHLLSEFQFASEMGPVADMSTFPPTMAAIQPDDGSLGMLSMDSILSGGFWDNVLVPGMCLLEVFFLF